MSEEKNWKVVRVMKSMSWGNRTYYHVTIPKPFVDALKLQWRDPLLVSVEDGRLVYKKVKGNE